METRLEIKTLFHGNLTTNLGIRRQVFQETRKLYSLIMYVEKKHLSPNGAQTLFILSQVCDSWMEIWNIVT